MGRRNLLRSNVAVYRPLILMKLGLIVSLIVIGAVVLVGVLGYLMEKSGKEGNGA